MGSLSSLKTKPPVAPPPPPIPNNWDRCHAYLTQKKRFCRQVPNKDSLYCGNHSEYDENIRIMTYIPASQPDINSGDSDGNIHKRPKLNPSNKPSIRIRIPCPLDGSHTIYASNLQKHLKKCNKAKDKRNDLAKVYYRHNINIGGRGSMYSQKDDITTESIEVSTTTTTTNRLKIKQKDETYYQNLAIYILMAYRMVFESNQNNNNESNNSSNDNDIKTKTKDDLYNYIPNHNYYTREDRFGFEKSLAEHRIKIGGPKHLQQIGSIVGHVRDMIFDSHSTMADSEITSSTKDKNDVTTILEMGAGRATTGFVVGSVLAACDTNINANDRNDNNNDNNTNIKLILVERAGSRGKADRAFRREERFRKVNKNDKEENQSGSKDSPVNEQAKLNKKDSNKSNRSSANHNKSTSYMNVNGVNVQRIKCDLAHVHLPTVLSMDRKNDNGVVIGNDGDNKNITSKDITTTSSQKVNNDKSDVPNKEPNSISRRDILVIAKHCCGAGTDIALKSLLPIKERVYGCLFTTCCHGICSWDAYVGRDYLHDIIMKAVTKATQDENNSNNNDSLRSLDNFYFGKEEFNLMKRWACGTVIHQAETKKADQNYNETNNEDEHSNDQKEINENKSEHQTSSPSTEKNDHKNDQMKNITFVVKSLNLKCGLEGLGRACQRLIDYGRSQYMQEHLFDAENLQQKNDGISHYVDSSVTPQNALLKGKYCQLIN